MSSSRTRDLKPHSRASVEMDDTDIINCICGKDKDDGFMIQCEQCLEWQHAACVHVKQNHIPAHYVCQTCKKGSRQYYNTSSNNKDKMLNRKKRKIKRAIYSSSSEDEEEEEEEEGNEEKEVEKAYKEIIAGSNGSGNNNYNAEQQQQQKRKKFVEITKNIAQDTEVDKLLHRLRKQYIQLQKSKEAGEKADSTIVKGFESFVTMGSEALTPSIPKASARPLQRSLRGASFTSQKDPSVQKGIFADIHIPEERYLLEIVGKIILKSDYKTSNNDYQTMEIPSRHVFFFRSLDLCIDARQYGNEGRFLRRSCRPNSEIKNIILPSSKKDGEFIHMGVFTRKEVDKGEEITLGWGWQRNHFVSKKKQEFMKKSSNVEFDDQMRVYIKKMLLVFKLEYGECACLDKDECFIEFLKEEIENNPPKKTKTMAVSNSTAPTKTAPTSTSHSQQHSQQQQHHQQQQQQQQSHISKKSKLTNDQIKKERVKKELTTTTTTTTTTKVTTTNNNITTTTTHATPPSPAGSVEDNDIVLLSAATAAAAIKNMPVKKRWLQCYQSQEQKSRQKTDPYPSDSSSNENIPLSKEKSSRKKLSLENYWNQRRN